MDATDLAKHYFDLSNARDLDRIESLFTETSTYSSDNQGLFFGRDTIMAMVRSFFGSFSSLHWTIVSAQEIKPSIVEIVFEFSGVDREGTKSQRRGLERIVVHQGKLRHVEVRNLED